MHKAGALRCIVLAFLWTAPALAGTAERDKGWETLIAEAKAHGGVETKLDKSVSYVFQRPDGSYLTFTRLNDGTRRSVCLVAEQENATACLDWDSAKLTLGDRADAATPWRFRTEASLDAFEAQQPGLLDKLLSTVQGFITSGGHSRRGGAGGYWRNSRDGNLYWVNSGKP